MNMKSVVNEDLIGIFEVDIEEAERNTKYPAETKFVKIQYDGEGYYTVNCLDENKDEITDSQFDGHRAEHRIEGALFSKPKGKYSIFV